MLAFCCCLFVCFAFALCTLHFQPGSTQGNCLTLLKLLGHLLCTTKFLALEGIQVETMWFQLSRTNSGGESQSTNKSSTREKSGEHLTATGWNAQVLTSWWSFAPDLRTLYREEKQVISEHVDVRMWSESNSNSVISFNIMSRDCVLFNQPSLFQMLFVQWAQPSFTSYLVHFIPDSSATILWEKLELTLL